MKLYSFRKDIACSACFWSISVFCCISFRVCHFPSLSISRILVILVVVGVSPSGQYCSLGRLFKCFLGFFLEFYSRRLLVVIFISGFDAMC
jgi:hypothetical protein